MAIRHGDPSAAPGRDASATRARILAAARDRFARCGYEATTVRAVAAEAGVAANLITRYFGGKAGLWQEATALDVDLAGVLAGPFEQLGHRYAAKVIERWEGADPADPLIMMVRSAGSSSDVADAVGGFFAAKAAAPLLAHLVEVVGQPADEASDRVASVGALVCGAVMVRYVMRVGPLASAATPAVQAWLADSLQRLLSGPPPPRLG